MSSDPYIDDRMSGRPRGLGRGFGRGRGGRRWAHERYSGGKRHLGDPDSTSSLIKLLNDCNEKKIDIIFTLRK